ncbi:PEP-CTERM sorting domain-containing protein [Desertibaculum subflavum]|uniref:PEP-CTERM sorting domain-containing protein n=1 Tax=Desertibaculum subflavum TaxID=2268458 RepID=UPI000E666A40
MLKNTLLAGAAVAVLAFASSAHAAAYSWSFTGGNSNDNGSAGNTRNFASSPAGISLTASAFYATSSSSNIQAAYLGHYSPGLGVTNTWNEDHYVDNGGRIDLVLFQFSQAIDIDSIILTSYGDADIKVWFGSNFAGGTINGDFGLTDLGSFSCNSSCNGNGEVQTYSNVNPLNMTGTYLLIAADPSGDNDEFKIRGLAASYSPPTTVAEPGTLALLGLGLAGLGAATRRKRSA